MGFRFSRRIRIAPGIRLNLGLKGISLSAGPRGASITVGRRGVHGNVGIPGTGLSYRGRLDGGRAAAQTQAPPSPPENVKIRFDGRTGMLLLDAQDEALQEPLLTVARSAYRDQILDALTERASVLNGQATMIREIHRDTPPPCASISPSPFSLPKPIKPDRDPGEDRVSGHAEAEWSGYMERLAYWRAAKAEHERLNGAPGDIDLALLERRIAELPWPREAHVSLEMSTDGKTLLADVDLPEIEDLPASLIAVSKRDLTLIEKPLSAAALRRDYLRHAHGVLFRIIGEAFASEVTPERMLIAGYTQRTASATGVVEDCYVISVSVDRCEWAKIDFSNLALVDPVAALARFDRSCSIDSVGTMRDIARPF
jgi:hypothetical protein